jgi:branched-chain amino acid transport system ATP-binding protein
MIDAAKIRPVLQIKGLHKSFGALNVTNDVGLSVNAGEIHALIGPNGAGKTTLIHQIAGLLKPDSGQILFEGQDITAASMPQRARLGLARTFQITSIVPSLSALGNVALAVQAGVDKPLGFWLPVDSDDSLNKPAQALLDIVGLGARAEVIAGRLSHGEKRALEIAMALALKPRAILLDEPMAGMGHEESARLTDLLKSLKGTYAMLLVEHDMEAVFSLADCVSVLVDGHVLATGPADMVRNDPQVRAAYLGDEAF